MMGCQTLESYYCMLDKYMPFLNFPLPFTSEYHFLKQENGLNLKKCVLFIRATNENDSVEWELGERGERVGERKKERERGKALKYQEVWGGRFSYPFCILQAVESSPSIFPCLPFYNLCFLGYWENTVSWSFFKLSVCLSCLPGELTHSLDNRINDL